MAKAAPAKYKTGTLKAKVVDTDGKGLEGASLEVHGLKGGHWLPKEKQVLTDSAGEVELKLPIKPGKKWHLKINLDGYGTAESDSFVMGEVTKDVEPKAGAAVDCEIKLRTDTEMKLKKLTANLEPFPGLIASGGFAHEREVGASEHDSPWVIIKDGVPLTVELFGVDGKGNPVHSGMPAKWTVERKDSAEGGLPRVVSKAWGRMAEVVPSAKGHFKLWVAVNDTKVDFDLFIFEVAVTIEEEPKGTKSCYGEKGHFGGKSDLPESVTARSGKWPHSDRSKVAWSAVVKCEIDAGSNADSMSLDRVKVYPLQNGIGTTVFAEYEDGWRIEEEIKAGTVLDCPSKQPSWTYNGPRIPKFEGTQKEQSPFFTEEDMGRWGDSAESIHDEGHHKGAYHNKGATRYLYMADSPASSFPRLRPTTDKELVKIGGAIKFRIAVAAISSEFPGAIAILKETTWDANLDGTVKDGKYTPGSGAGVTARSWSAPRGKDAQSAGFVIKGPTYIYEAYSMRWQLKDDKGASKGEIKRDTQTLAPI